MAHANLTRVTRADVERVLERAEVGQTTVEDANLLRSYLRMLEALVNAYQQTGPESTRGTGQRPAPTDQGGEDDGN